MLSYDKIIQEGCLCEAAINSNRHMADYASLTSKTEKLLRERKIQ